MTLTSPSTLSQGGLGHCSEVCFSVTVLCLFDSVLAGVFSCGPLFVTHVSLFTVFRDFGAEVGYFARR